MSMSKYGNRKALYLAEIEILKREILEKKRLLDSFKEKLKALDNDEK